MGFVSETSFAVFDADERPKHRSDFLDFFFVSRASAAVQLAMQASHVDMMLAIRVVVKSGQAVKVKRQARVELPV